MTAFIRPEHMTLYQDAQAAPQAQFVVQPPAPPAAPGAPVGVPMVIEHTRGSTEKQEKMFFVAFLVVVLAAAAILYPIARAFARRLEGGARRSPELGPGTAEQLQRIEHTVEAMAIEIERLSEGQRFTTKLLASRENAVPGPTDAERSRLR